MPQSKDNSYLEDALFMIEVHPQKQKFKQLIRICTELCHEKLFDACFKLIDNFSESTDELGKVIVKKIKLAAEQDFYKEQHKKIEKKENKEVKKEESKDEDEDLNDDGEESEDEDDENDEDDEDDKKLDEVLDELTDELKVEEIKNKPESDNKEVLDLSHLSEDRMKGKIHVGKAIQVEGRAKRT